MQQDSVVHSRSLAYYAVGTHSNSLMAVFMHVADTET